MQANIFLAASPSSHPVLAALNSTIMDAAEGVPKNPWTLASLPAAQFNSFYDCNGSVAGITAKGNTLSTPTDNRGWCYGGASGAASAVVDGMIWTNSQKNGSPNALTENTY